MKRCPECRKNYLDESLVYCLDDGARLVQGTVSEEPATAILSGNSIASEIKLGSGETAVPLGRTANGDFALHGFRAKL